MRVYDYRKVYNGLLQPDIVSLIAKIHEYKGEQTFFIKAKADTLSQLVEIAKLQSTEASNKMEGICTSDERLKKIVRDKTMPKTRSEKEIAGYRDVLGMIRENHDFIPVKSSNFLQLHRDLYKFTGGNDGSYRNTDNVIAEEELQGNEFVQFQLVPAWETAESIEAICTAFEEACRVPDYDELILIPMFILDFLCIHPFDNGNGRMSRLLMLLLLYRAGYIVGEYISIEKLIEQSKETYYEALQFGSAAWHEGNNDYLPFVRYMLGIVIAAYQEFSSRVQLLAANGLSKPERVREVIKAALGRITRTEIMEKCPDISRVTVERALNELVKSGKVLKIGGGRYTAYVWNWEDE